ncbi:MAG TPA: two-component sensor histidine kinase [Candidatus Limivivens intestinipullorum]|uniref:histidine kinase n=1 Tax=Candidatus Limivivens intestinipullorum TaxID=2840858 RepID=A0A9D1ET26_9FIRM|nr:two-component sensor histidine kinase [Candidatus Limivivens intestinipullorum]
MLALLVVCCMIIYGMVMIFLPGNYRSELEGQVTSDFYDLVEELERNGWEAGSQSLMEFSISNHASVEIMDDNGTLVFSVNYADMENPDLSVPSMSCSAAFRQGGQTYQLVSNASLAAVSQSYAMLLKLIPFIAAVILLISLISAVICSHYYSRPLVSICTVAKRMTTLDMTWKCQVNRRDEIGVLAASLNEMARRLSSAMDRLQAANDRLQQDIEREREQEKQRIDFFTAVSHELKTPIAILKGEMEGMLYQVGEYRDRDAYLRHCLKITDDMGKIVKEILLAARMGGNAFQLVCSDLDLSQMAERACRKFLGRIEDKGMHLTMDIRPEVHYRGAGRLLEMALDNVLSNAVIYSPAGAWITVSLKDGKFSAENSGVHIPEEDLKQIFEPFYRPDKSRNRNSGGSGLGLYITKMILERHGIDFCMENTENGVRFMAVFSRMADQDMIE